MGKTYSNAISSLTSLCGDRDFKILEFIGAKKGNHTIIQRHFITWVRRQENMRLTCRFTRNLLVLSKRLAHSNNSYYKNVLVSVCFSVAQQRKNYRAKY